MSKQALKIARTLEVKGSEERYDSLLAERKSIPEETSHLSPLKPSAISSREKRGAFGRGNKSQQLANPGANKWQEVHPPSVASQVSELVHVMSARGLG